MSIHVDLSYRRFWGMLVFAMPMLFIPSVLFSQVIDPDKPSMYNGFFSKQADTTLFVDTTLIPVTQGNSLLMRGNTPSVSQTNSLLQSVPSSYLHPHIPNIFEVDRNKAVGEIPLQAGVSPSGANTYQVPIEVVPGRHGMQPNISIAYNSQGGNGVLGMGWAIGGLSSINHTNYSLYFDGTVQSTIFANTDPFSLDGIRLIKTYGSDTRNDYISEQGNIKVSVSISGRYITSIRAQYPNGTIGTYGYDNTNNTNRYYPLTKLTDKLGNYVSYTYIYRNEHYYINRITYGSTINGNPTDYASVQFNYRTRSDIIKAYVVGVQVTEDYLLDNVVCYSGNVPLRTYSLTYQTGQQPLLTRIDCNVGGQLLNPLQFYYGFDGQTANLLKQETLLASYFATSELMVNKGKFEAYSDDDGLIVYPAKDPYKQIITGTHVEYVSEFHTDQELLVYHGLKEAVSIPQSITAGEGFVQLLSADIDGNAGEEVIQINNYSPIFAETGYRLANLLDFTIYKSIPLPPSSGQTSALSYQKKISFNLSPWRYTLPTRFIAGDFNGDGKMEIFAITIKAHINNYFNGEEESRAFLFDLDGNGVKLFDGYAFTYKPEDIVFAMDYDGDGKMDICRIHSGGTDIYYVSTLHGAYNIYLKNTYPNLKLAVVSGKKILLGDINGDGLTDIVLSPMESYTSQYQATVSVATYRVCPGCSKYNANGLSVCSCGRSLLGASNCFQCGSTLNSGTVIPIPPDPSPSPAPYAEFDEPHFHDTGYGEHDHDCHAEDTLLHLMGVQPPTPNGGCPYCGQTVTITRSEYVDYGNGWGIYLSKGNGTFEMQGQSLVNREKGDSFVLEDMNGDGIPDLVRQTQNGVVQIFLTQNGIISSTPQSSYTTTANQAELIPSIVAMNQFYSQLLVIKNGQIYKIGFSRNDRKQQLLTAAVNSLGVVSKTDYQRLSDAPLLEQACYTKGTDANYPYDNFSGPLFVVSKTQGFAGNNDPFSSISYHYTNAVIHKQGLGFQGFEKMRVTDEFKGVNVEKTFRPYYFGVPLQEESPVYKASYNYYVDIAANKVRQTRLMSKTEQDKLKGHTVSTNYTIFDTYGFPLMENVTYADGFTQGTQYQYLHKNTAEDYVLGMLLSQTSTLSLGSANNPQHINTMLANNPGEGEPPVEPPVGGDPGDPAEPPTIDPDPDPEIPLVTPPSVLSTWKTREVYTYNSLNKPATLKRYVRSGTGPEGLLEEQAWEYDAMGNMVLEKGKPYTAATWFSTAYTYDPTGRFVTQMTNAMGLSTHYANFNSLGQAQTVTDYRSNVSTYHYDVFGRNIQIQQPDGVTIHQKVDWVPAGSNLLYFATDSATGSPAGRTFYDALRRTVKQGTQGFDGAYVYTDNLYDEYSRLWKTSDPYTDSPSRWTENSYDNYDRLTRVSAPNGKIVTYSYNGFTTTENNAGLTTSKTYNARGQLLQATDPAGTVHYALRVDGQPSSVQVNGMVTTSFEYDKYGRQTALHDPAAGSQTYTYDAAGNIASQTDAGNHTVHKTYNAFGQILTEQNPEFTLTYAYNTDYTLQSVSSTNGSAQGYTYDALGRTSSVSERIGETTFTKTYTCQNGKLATVTYSPMGTNPIHYLYNAYGYLKELQDNMGTSLWQLNQVNTRGQALQQTLGNGVEQSYAYTSEGLPVYREVSNVSAVLQRQQYTFDAAKGLLTSRTDSRRGLTEAFGYDELLRLTDYGTSTVQYNGLGNITQKSDAGTMVYNVAGKPYAIGEQQQTPGTVPVRYIRDWLNGSNVNVGNHWVEIQAMDINGSNLALGKPVQSGGVMYSPALITDGNTESEPYTHGDWGVSQYVTIDLGQAYDVSNIKIWHYYADARTYQGTKTEVSSDGVHWTVLHDASTGGEYQETPEGRRYGFGASVPAREQDVSYTAFRRPATITENGYQAEFTYLPNHQRVKMQVKRHHQLLLTRYYFGGNYEKETNAAGTTVAERLYVGGMPYDAPVVFCRENGQWKVRYLHRDYLGSITLVSDEYGQTLEENSFDAWGRLRDPGTLACYGPDNQPALYLGRGFTGHEHLPWFGLINMNARLYDPVLGRFLAADPYVQMPDVTQSFNRYTYALNNPLMFTDESGELFWLIPVGIGALIGGYSGYKIGHANGATGWNMLGYIAGGALIGGAAGGAAMGVSLLGGGAMVTGATAGAFGGAGFSGLATNWNGIDMLKGAGIGALSGLVGGGFGSAIGGGWGALAGGGASNMTSQLLYTGKIDWGQTALSTAISFGMYHGISYASWKWGGGNSIEGNRISYRQFNAMNRDYQRSRFWKKEYGGYLMNDGSVQRFPASSRHNFGIDPTGRPNDAFMSYHTHWAQPGIQVLLNANADYASTMDILNGQATISTTERYHSQADLQFDRYVNIPSVVINRYDFSYNPILNMSNYNDPFIRFMFFPCLTIKK